MTVASCNRVSFQGPMVFNDAKLFLLELLRGISPRVLEPHLFRGSIAFQKDVVFHPPTCLWKTVPIIWKGKLWFIHFILGGFWNVDFFRDVYPMTFMPFIVTLTSQRSTRRSPRKVIPTNVGTSGSLCLPPPRKFEMDTWKLVGFDSSLVKISGDSWGHLPSNANDLCYVIRSLNFTGVHVVNSGNLT